MLVYDDTVTERRPALFMQPDWLGVCDHSADMAAQAGGSDFVVMVADMFGKGLWRGQAKPGRTRHYRAGDP